MARTAQASLPESQMDWLIEQATILRDVHAADLAGLQKELRIKNAEIASQKLVLLSAHLALKGCRGLQMPPHARDRVSGALVATGRALGIKTVDV